MNNSVRFDQSEGANMTLAYLNHAHIDHVLDIFCILNFNKLTKI